MSNTPSDAEIDEVTLDVLGYAALDKETNETARMIARAVLAKWGTPPAEQQASATETAPVVQPGAVYANKPDSVAWLAEYGGDVFTAAQLLNFADRTHALRMQAAPKAAPQQEAQEPAHPTAQADSQPAMTPETVYAAIAHGDQDHRAWLLSALRAVWCGEAVPPVAPPIADAAAESQPEPVREHDLQDVRCECCGYMTYHLEHTGCIRAARAPAESVTAPGGGVLASREAEIALLKKALMEAKAAPQQEPVAWLNPWRADQVTTDYDAYGERGIPLYTAPQPAPDCHHRPPCDECCIAAQGGKA